MAEEKKSFILYVDLIHTIEKLPNEDAGELFKHILRYVNDKNPTTENILVDVTFEPIKQQLKRDLRKYEDKKVQWSDAGKRSAEVRKANKKQRTLTDVEVRSTDLTVTVKDTVIVKDIIYTQTNFLEDWKKARLHYDKQPTNITSLKAFELINFNKILKDYGSDDFYQAINGLFFQETFKSTRLRPTHFLDNFETYLTCWQTKEKLFENKKKEIKL
jgi:hypothetical protein